MSTISQRPCRAMAKPVPMLSRLAMMCVMTAGDPVLAQIIETLPPKAPIARQIVPMVPSLQRKTPASAGANLVAAAKRVTAAAAGQRVAAGPAKAAVTASVTPVARRRAVVVVAAPVPLPSPVLAGTQALQPGAQVAAGTTVAAAAPAAAPATGSGKFVATTCRVGQDYSVARRTCFTPGVTVASSGKGKARQAAGRKALARAAAEPGHRSALGSALGSRRKP